MEWSEFLQLNFEDQYDPRDVTPYYGTTIVAGEQHLRITLDWALTGKERYEGLRIALIAGLGSDPYSNARARIQDRDWKGVESIIHAHGQPLDSGLHLVVTFDSPPTAYMSGVVTMIQKMK